MRGGKINNILRFIIWKIEISIFLSEWYVEMENSIIHLENDCSDETRG